MTRSRHRLARKHNASNIYAMVVCILLSILQLGAACAQAPSLRKTDPGKNVVQRISECINIAMEAVLTVQDVQCAPYGKGANSLPKLPKEMPFEWDVADTCKSSADSVAGTNSTDSTDWRKLPGNAIKSIAQQQPSHIDPQGIRVVGAIFCDRLDLIGLDLPYSLVLDRSIFAKGIEARNFKAHADVSFDYSVILDELRLSRARIDGSIFTNNSLVDQVAWFDAEVHGSIIFRNSMFLRPAVFDTVSLSGELSLRNSNFSYLFLQFSKVGGVLDLTSSYARCAYLIRNSEIAHFVAVDAGFGVSKQVPGSSRSYDWRDRETSKLIKAALTAPPDSGTLRAAEDQQCQYSTITLSPGTFKVIDAQIKSQLCLRSFHWLSPEVPSFLSFDDITVGTTSSIDFDADPSSMPASQIHHFELISFKTASLIFDFQGFLDEKDAYKLAVNGLSFDHVYATKDLCGYDPRYADPPPDSPPQPDKAFLESLGDPGARLPRPRVDQVMSWLDGNSLVTTQPFLAFVDAFQKHGEENDAKELKIRKSLTELCFRTRRFFPGWAITNWIIDLGCGNLGVQKPDGTETSSQNETSSRHTEKTAILSLGNFGRLIGIGSDFAAIFFGWLLALVADHGYRPEKVVWSVLFTLLLFWSYFKLRLGIVGLKPKEKNIILPVGPAFLFDRLLPAYQIRQDHYNISAFYKKAPKKTLLLNTENMRRFWGLSTIKVVEATPDEAQRAEKSLDVLKALGLALAIFLVAAINAIILH